MDELMQTVTALVKEVLYNKKKTNSYNYISKKEKVSYMNVCF